jgi:hypothetical protein
LRRSRPAPWPGLRASRPAAGGADLSLSGKGAQLQEQLGPAAGQALAQTCKHPLAGDAIEHQPATGRQKREPLSQLVFELAPAAAQQGPIAQIKAKTSVLLADEVQNGEAALAGVGRQPQAPAQLLQEHQFERGELLWEGSMEAGTLFPYRLVNWLPFSRLITKYVCQLNSVALPDQSIDGGGGLAQVDKYGLSERDICTKIITPAIQAAGWEQAQFREEVSITDGRIMVRGKLAARVCNPEAKGGPKRADYVLYSRPNVPLAVVEAKQARFPVGHGMQQALTYAEMLDAPFAISSNGDCTSACTTALGLTQPDRT